MMYEAEYESSILAISHKTGLNNVEIRSYIEKLAEKYCEDRLLTATMILAFSQSVFQKQHQSLSAKHTIYPIWTKLYDALRATYVDGGVLLSVAQQVFAYTHEEIYDSLYHITEAVQSYLLTFQCYECNLRLPLGLDIKIDITRPLESCLECVYCYNKKIDPEHIDIEEYVKSAKRYVAKKEYLVTAFTYIPAYLYTQMAITDTELIVNFIQTKGEEPLKNEVEKCYHMLQHNGFDSQLSQNNLIAIAI